ncbi:iron ABC transporter permease, partial [Dietzia sp. E1]|nr:iron ABC transporter permease [Dietzia sp. E1]
MTSVAAKPDRRAGQRPPARARADLAVVSPANTTGTTDAAPSARRPLALICLPLLAALVVAIAAGVSLGSVAIPIGDVWAI